VIISTPNVRAGRASFSDDPTRERFRQIPTLLVQLQRNIHCRRQRIYLSISDSSIDEVFVSTYKLINTTSSTATMPVIASPFYENEKAGGALENAAEEILNGIFCHYEPPTSTKAQKNAADAVRKDPTKFLYDEQPTKPALRVKKGTRASFGSTTHYQDQVEYEAVDQREDESTISETPMDVETPMTNKEGKGVKWRDEESKKIEVTKTPETKSGFCISIPFCGIGTTGEEGPKGLTDTHDEHSVVKRPDTPGAQTPTKSVLKKTNDMKVLYDDEGNPLSTPRSPGSIQSHPFFRNVTNSPRGTVYEPVDYSNPSTPKSKTFKMPRNDTPRPDRDGSETTNDENNEVRLAKIGSSPHSPNAAWAPVPMSPMSPMRTDAKAKSYIPKSPKSYMAASPRSSQLRNFDAGCESDGFKPDVMDIVQKLNKSGFIPGRRYRPGFSPKSPSARSDYSDLTMSVVQHHGYETKNDSRLSSGGKENKRSFVVTRRVAAPAPLVLSSPAEVEQAPASRPSVDPVEMSRVEMSRDPPPRQLKIRELEDALRTRAALPPTPRRKEPVVTSAADVAPAVVDTSTNYSVRQQVSAAERSMRVTEKKPSVKEEKKLEPQRKKSETSQRREHRETNHRARGKQNEKKGFMKGIKKSFGKLKAVVNDIDEQRLGGGGGKIVRKDGAVIRHV
jgi:hypothetical protein